MLCFCGERVQSTYQALLVAVLAGTLVSGRFANGSTNRQEKMLV